MRIMVNGSAREVEADTLAAALEALGHGGAAVATAHNEVFVPAAARAETRLAPGDRIEILAPMQGG
ncbi:sulfur carrier protein [Limimaricola variabilis]|uniref:Sulfur carrier protein n=1 Tax=Limimaricola variabilis TaxID=1492771 RepID=A0ABR6HMX1_9RHOB|nr:sulfur carrier protein ThiS [Limimaricola variabilis]MBB3711904.1 sulfur carrier protein [Limimaricola variabilis]WPY96686.1 sulfur carrier protein ThiS [Limimaricola variabilis]